MKSRQVFAAAVLVALTSIGNASAEETQFTLLHDSYLHQTRYKFWQFGTQPQDWTSPVDYSRGTTYVRYEVTSIAQPAALQFCYFQDSHIPENHACAPEWRFDKPGVYYMKQDMGTIWQRSGIEWTRPLLDFMIIDNLSMGAGKVQLTVDIVVVGAGAALAAPDNWTCPVDWHCVGGGGGSGGTGGTSSGGAGGAPSGGAPSGGAPSGGAPSGGAGGAVGGSGGASGGSMATGGADGSGGESSGGSVGAGGAAGGGAGGSASGGVSSGGAASDGGSPNSGGSPSSGGTKSIGGSPTSSGGQSPTKPPTSGTGGELPDPDGDGEVKSGSFPDTDSEDAGCMWANPPMTGGSTAWATLFGVLGWAAVRRRNRHR